MAEGYHTPMTREAIADLYRAGRLRNDTPCKHAAKTGWQTIDELFPLLKYDSCPPLSSRISDRDESSHGWLPIALGCAAVLILGAIFIFFTWHNRAPETAPAAIQSTIGGSTVLPRPQPPATSGSQDFSASQTAQSSRQRADNDRLAREQVQRDQAARADGMRAERAREERERQKAAGRDQVVPLNQSVPIDVGGSNVEVRIVDNDTTSIDVWINAVHYRAVPKQKGISHSGADETLLYSNGRASLYYVWEISGELNHCLLRVRDE